MDVHPTIGLASEPAIQQMEAAVITTPNQAEGVNRKLCPIIFPIVQAINKNFNETFDPDIISLKTPTGFMNLSESWQNAQ